LAYNPLIVKKETTVSLNSWKFEFYPTPASDCKSGIEAVEHSLQKWKGLTKKSLKQHGMRQWKDTLFYEPADPSDDDMFSLDSDTCAMCEIFFDGDRLCDLCPIKLTTGMECSDDNSIYQRYIRTGNGARKMVAVLKKIREDFSTPLADRLNRKQ
jgi:hypothetical protein